MRTDDSLQQRTHTGYCDATAVNTMELYRIIMCTLQAISRSIAVHILYKHDIEP